jgi:hypothetical protein
MLWPHRGPIERYHGKASAQPARSGINIGISDYEGNPRSFPKPARSECCDHQKNSSAAIAHRAADALIPV